MGLTLALVLMLIVIAFHDTRALSCRSRLKDLCFHISKATFLILKIWVSLSKGNRANESFSRLNNLDK